MNGAGTVGALGLVQGGWRFARHAELISTLDEAARIAAEGDPGRIWVVAERQSGGRGRRGREWVSPPGNLYATALLVDPCPPANSSQLGFVAGVAVAEMAFALGAVDAQLKWPNDLLWRGAKMSGILVEGRTLGSRFAALVGIGVNCASAPEGLSYPATHLSAALGRKVEPLEALDVLATAFESSLTLWDRGAGFTALRRAWLDKAAGLGQVVRVNSPVGVREGRFVDLDADGRMILETAAGREVVEVGDLEPFGAPTRMHELGRK